MSDCCVVRQPMFTRDGDLLGYEIRFRDTPDGRDAFARSFLTGAFDNVRADRPAFVPVSRGQFLDQILQLADPLNTIPLIPADVGADPDIVDAVQRFCAAGGQIALDEVSEHPSASAALLPLAHWVRVDVRTDNVAVLASIVSRVRAQGDVKLMAGHVYDPSQLARARSLGFDAFEGAHFSRLERLGSGEWPSFTLSALRPLG